MLLKADTKEKKQKIKQLNQEIANMKRDNYEIFYKAEIENKKGKKIKPTLFNILFAVSFCIFSISIIMFLTSIKSGGIFIGTSVIPKGVLAIPFLAGVLFIFILKDKTIPIIIAFFGLFFILSSFALSKEISLSPRPLWMYILIFIGIFIGVVSYTILFIIKVRASLHNDRL